MDGWMDAAQTIPVTLTGDPRSIPSILHMNQRSQL
jgi:hypothetical protein